MSTTLELIELSTTADKEDDECHLVCDADERWSLCGRNVEADQWAWETGDDCEDCPCCDEFDRADFCAHCAMGEP